MSSLLLNFQKCTGRARMVAVSSVSSLPTGTVMGMKFQLIKTRPWPSGNKNWQMCATMLQLTNGWWWTDATTNLYKKNLSEAIRVANELFPDVTFVHSSFDEYVQAVESALPEQLSTVTGELTSQETDGWLHTCQHFFISHFAKEFSKHRSTGPCGYDRQW